MLLPSSPISLSLVSLFLQLALIRGRIARNQTYNVILSENEKENENESVSTSGITSMSLRYTKRLIVMCNSILMVVVFGSIAVNSNANVMTKSMNPLKRLARVAMEATNGSIWFFIAAFLIANETTASEAGKTSTLSSWFSILGMDIWSNSITNTEPPYITLCPVVPKKNSLTQRKQVNDAQVRLTKLLPMIQEAEERIEAEEEFEASTKWRLNLSKFQKGDKSLDLFSAIVSAFRPGVVGSFISGLSSFSFDFHAGTVSLLTSDHIDFKLQYLNLIFLSAYFTLRFAHLFSRRET